MYRSTVHWDHGLIAWNLVNGANQLFPLTYGNFWKYIFIRVDPKKWVLSVGQTALRRKTSVMFFCKEPWHGVYLLFLCLTSLKFALDFSWSTHHVVTHLVTWENAGEGRAPDLTNYDLVLFAKQIAAGMVFLGSRRVRGILVTCQL